MKRTTYIIIGLFVLGLLLIPVLLRTPAGEKVARRLSMEGERTEIEMAGIRHVKIVEKLGWYRNSRSAGCAGFPRFG